MTRETLGITNDQVFKRVFGSDKELCRRLIELALEIPVSSIEYVESQHESREIKRPGGAYFDVMATLESGELIDVEMQAGSRPDMLRRARHYLGRLTTEEWSKVTANQHTYNYSELPDAAVIFVCDFDPLGDGIRRYTGKMVYRGTTDHTGDGAIAVLLNAKGAGDDIEPDLAAFLAYVANGRFSSGKCSFVDRIAHRVDTVNTEIGMQGGRMKSWDEILWWSKQDGIKEGKAEGLAEGHAEGLAEGQRIISKLASRMTADGRANELADVLTDQKRLDEELKHYDLAARQ